MNIAVAIPQSEREFHFTKQDFERVAQLIYRHAGIALNPSKQEMVYSRLARRLRANHLTRFDEYLALLECGDAAEWEAFTNSLTTNLTAFFREEHHFPVLAQRLLDRRCPQPLQLWCCASSTGEEAYSMAITACEAFDTLIPPVRILATDLDTQVLAQAQTGIYAKERVVKLPRDRLKRFFLKGSGKHAGMVRVRPELQQFVTFSQLNLLDQTWPVRGPFEAIFCRNVMIYFDKRTQRALLERFQPLLSPGGLLFAGHSESLHHAADLFRPCGKTVYELHRGALHG